MNYRIYIILRATLPVPVWIQPVLLVQLYGIQILKIRESIGLVHLEVQLLVHTSISMYFGVKLFINYMKIMYFLIISLLI